MDYNDLFHFNFSDAALELPSDEPRGALNTEEATRHIVMDLRVSAILAPGQDDGQTLPVVEFKGTSRSVDVQWDPNANSKIRGSVSLTPDGQVRWKTISVFHG